MSEQTEIESLVECGCPDCLRSAVTFLLDKLDEAQKVIRSRDKEIEELNRERDDYKDMLRVLVEDVAEGKHHAGLASIHGMCLTELKKYGYEPKSKNAT